MHYEPPTVRDYGDLLRMTGMQAVTGLTEDSAIKAVPFHHEPPVSTPTGP